jgi:hypothetical protein
MGPLILLLTVLANAAASTAPSTAPAPPKFLIEFGWDEPTTAFMREHIAQMERTPFDGTVYHLQYRKSDGAMGSFMNDCWGMQSFSDAQLQNALDDLAHTPFHTFTHNFIRFNVLPGNVDWFDDYSAVLHNAQQSARIASLSSSEGILFDDEQYNYPLFDFAKLNDKNHRTWQAYGRQARRRGAQIMGAFQKGWSAAPPHRPLVIMLTFGLSLPYEESQTNPGAAHQLHYALLVPFLQGMFDAASPDDRIVDGCELAYGFKTPREFTDQRDVMLEKSCTLLDDRRPYLQHIRPAFGLWLDFEWKERPFYTDDLTRNYFTPLQFEKSVAAALENSDRFVWIYTEKPRWWTPAGPSADLPTAYVEALQRAKANCPGTRAP